MKTAVLLLNHFEDGHLYRLRDELVADCSAAYDIWLLSDRTRKQLPLLGRKQSVAEFTFTRQDLESLGYIGKQGIAQQSGPRNMMLGNAELPVMLFHRAHPEYERLWIIEYDVRFTGSWRTLLDHFANSDAALIGTTLTPYPACKHWSHWQTLDIPDASYTHADWVRGFFPVYRLNAEAIQCLHTQYTTYASGHMEGLMPTVVKNSGLEIRDLGGDGPFVAPGDENRFYQNSPDDNRYSPGTFVYRPAREQAGSQPDTLWHPVKPAVSFPLKAARYLFRRVTG